MINILYSHASNIRHGCLQTFSTVLRGGSFQITPEQIHSLSLLTKKQHFKVSWVKLAEYRHLVGSHWNGNTQKISDANCVNYQSCLDNMKLLAGNVVR